MRTQFIPLADAINARDYDSHEMAADIDAAEKLAPWAAEIIEVEGGWKAFESVADADIAKTQV